MRPVGKCQHPLTESGFMREKALAVDNSGRISVENCFEINLIVDKYARGSSLLANADSIYARIDRIF